MSEQNLLAREVLSSKAHIRAHRNHLWVALAFAAFGGALGSAAVIATAATVFFGAAETEPSAAIHTPAPAAAVATVEPTAVAPVAVPVPEVAKAPARAAGIIVANDARLIIETTVDDRWLSSGPEVISQDDIGFVLEREVDATVLPADIRGLVGKPVTLLDKNGDSCAAIVGDMSAVRVIYDYLDEDSDDAVATAWGWGEPTLVAKLEDVGDGCAEDFGGALIGAADYKATPITELDEKSALAAKAAAAWKTGSGWAEAQKAYEQIPVDERTTPTWDHGTAPSVTLVGTPQSGVVIVGLSNEMCGEVGGTFSAAYRVEAGAIGEQLAIPANKTFYIAGAADANGDGLPELFASGDFGWNGLFTSDVSKTGYEASEGADVSWHHCSC